MRDRDVVGRAERRDLLSALALLGAQGLEPRRHARGHRRRNHVQGPARASAVERAWANALAWLVGKAPRPAPFMNTGSPARVANAVNAAAASSHQIPPPATTTGRSAPASSRPSVSRAAGSAAPRGRWTYAVGIGASRSSIVVISRSTGISTKTGPGRPESAVRIAVVRT